VWLKNVDWWAKKHVVFGKDIVVNWKMVLIMVCVWIGMALFLPGGLLF
jgi:hypothetical protein